MESLRDTLKSFWTHGGRQARRECREGAVALFAVLTILLLAGPALARPKAPPHPDLTKGGKPNDPHDFNVGPTGFRGWAYLQSEAYTGPSRQILVKSIEAGSPADGKLAVGDVILGVDGKGATGDPALFSYDSRVAIADAINDAEARSPATLKLLCWRAGVTTTVTLTLETMGAYSATAPYNCEKSRKILRKCTAYLAKHGEDCYAGEGALVFLAANDPNDPNNADYQARARALAHGLILSPEQIAALTSDNYNGGGHWGHGYMLITLAEYYLQTGDKAVFPSLEAYAIRFSKGQSWWGTTGGKGYSFKTPEGKNNGRLGGYGCVNSSGVTGFLGLVLAKEAGVKNTVVDEGISRAERFYAYYAHKGTIPYGEDGAMTLMYDMNGKNSGAALAFALLPKRVDEARYFSRMAGLAGRNRYSGHAGPYFNVVWPPLGAAVTGEEVAAHYFKQTRWTYDLARCWDGRIVYDIYFTGSNNGYGNFSPALPTLTTYALPLRQLHITGRNRNPALRLDAKGVAETVAAETFDASACDTKQLLAALRSWSPLVREQASKELGTRTGEHASLLPVLHAMALDTSLDSTTRGAVCHALGKIGNATSAPILAKLLTDTNSYVRLQAAGGLSGVPNEAAMAQIKTILSACVTTLRPVFPFPDDDPLQVAHAELARLLFEDKVRMLGNRNSGVDRSDPLFQEAMRSLAQTPIGGARSAMTGQLYSKLEYGDVVALADMILNTGLNVAPADAMFSLEALRDSSEVLQRHAIADAVHLGKASTAHAPLRLYGGSQLKDPSPKPLTPLKAIKEVTADTYDLKLPARSTRLHVSATNYGVRAAGDTFYTWRQVYGPGRVTFTPNGTAESKDTAVSLVDGLPGKYRFEVTVSDVLGYTEIYDTVNITLRDANGVLPPNRAPSAAPQSLIAAAGVARPVILTGSDPEGALLWFEVTQGPTKGVLSGDAPDHLVYKANYGYTGTDSLTFKVTDGGALSATGTVSFTVTKQSTGVTLYEPFDYGKGALNGKSGKSEVGLSGVWSADPKCSLLSAGSFSYATLPSAGSHVLGPRRKRDGGTATRSLDTAAFSRDRLLSDGGELWFSAQVGFSGGDPNASIAFGLKNKAKSTPSVGFIKGTDTCVASVNGQSAASPRGSSHPDGRPLMFVGKCSWGATPEDKDTVSIYRVDDGPDGQPILSPSPPSQISALVDQEKLDTLYFDYGGSVLLDEIRVGPTYNSVLIGTGKGAEEAGKPKLPVVVSLIDAKGRTIDAILVAGDRNKITITIDGKDLTINVNTLSAKSQKNVIDLLTGDHE